MSYLEYSLICLVLILIVGIAWLYYDLGVMTVRKEQWRLIALEGEKMAKRMKIVQEIEETCEG